MLADPLFRRLYRQLLLSYLTVIITIFGVVGVTLYRRVTTRLYKQFDRELAIASQTGIKIFPLVHHEYHEHLAERRSKHFNSAASTAGGSTGSNLGVEELLNAYRDGIDPADGSIVDVIEAPNPEPLSAPSFYPQGLSLTQLSEQIKAWLDDDDDEHESDDDDDDDDEYESDDDEHESDDEYESDDDDEVDETLSAIDRSIGLNNLTLEWFDTDLHRMLIESDPQGGIQSTSLPDPRQVDRAVSDVGLVRRWTSPVYDTDRRLLGYVRASGSIVSIQAELNRLAIELWFGALLALSLAALSGQWLTRRALTPIVQSFEQLRRFTADASHELRSPLTSIATSIATLQRSPSDTPLADCQSNLVRIVQSSDRMTLLVRDLLLLARSDGGLSTTTEVNRRFSLDELLDNLVDEIEPIADRHGIELQFAPPESHPAGRSTDVATWDIQGNPQHLHRAFFNLIDNAIHYTPAGGTVSIALKRLDSKLMVQIRDTGIGIAAQDLPHIFDRFWRADEARSRRTNGSGLGLSIVATIIREQGGRIEVKSTIGQGTEFQIWLPESV